MSASTAAPGDDSLVVLDYAELLASPPSPAALAAVARGFGAGGLGLLLVRGVPGYAEARAACLPTAFRFGALPRATQAKYEDAASSYSFGWSHGKEKLEGGRADTAKGSYYANPTHDAPARADEASRWPPFFAPNVWPVEADAPGFEAAFKALGRLLVGTGLLLSRAVDAHVRAQLPAYGDAARGLEALEATVAGSRCAKARLLFYFPAPATGAAGGAAEGAAELGATDVSSWCGWHNDHGALTALASAMYFDADGREIACPDPRAGLFIRSRSGALVRAAIPPDCCAFQCGETLQIASGGLLRATPHCVRAADAAGVSRATMAVFMEPEPLARMSPPAGADVAALLAGAEHLPRGVPTLASRFKIGDSFAEFTTKTLAAYY